MLFDFQSEQNSFVNNIFKLSTGLLHLTLNTEDFSKIGFDLQILPINKSLKDIEPA
jgi:hypothetical protein